ncbi:MAG: AAA family ATPase [Candidatus Jordarchaeum sp.]|uniref:AAA family ATPase n=1 Tax=Candidatus Jordarchaeum sp. TaxID=2823881 RepID=UPI00404A96E1
MPKSRRIRVDYISTPLADVPTVDALEDVINSINSLKEELDAMKENTGGLSGEMIETVKQSINTLTERINGIEVEGRDFSEKLDSISGALAAAILLMQRAQRQEESIFQIVIKKPEELIFTFDHLGNYSEEKTQLEHYVSLLRKIPDLKSKGSKLNGKLLIHGRTGTGKTKLVYALAKEAKVPIIDFQKSLAFGLPDNLITGIHVIFKFIREDSQNKPLILFIDNFDALAKSRDLFQSPTLSAVLDELDATNVVDHSVLVIAATNRPDLLDAAVWTRFDDVLHLSLPDARARTEILHVLLSPLLYEKNVDFPQISEATENFSGADLENLISRTVVLLEKRRKKVLTTDILLEIAHSMRTEILQRIREKSTFQKKNKKEEDNFQQSLIQDIVTNDKKYERLLLALTKLKGGDSLSSDEIAIAKNFEFLTSNPEKGIEILKEKRERVQRVQETMQKMWGAKT